MAVGMAVNMDDDDNLLERIMQQTLEENNERMIDNIFGRNNIDNIDNVDNGIRKKNLHQYCHFDYGKKITECIVCMERRISHKCFQCEYWVCTACFVKINTNPKSSRCPSCRYEYNMDMLERKMEQNIDLISNKYDFDANIMHNSKFEEKELTNKSRIYFRSEYNYRDNRLEIAVNIDKPDGTKVDMLKINLNIRNYNADVQNKLVTKMYNIYNSIGNDVDDVDGNIKTREWNSTSSRIIKMLRHKINNDDLLQYLDGF